MLTTIQELEEKIDLFRKNVKDSNDLMEILTSATSLIKAQTESFKTCTETLQNDLGKQLPKLSDLFQKTVESFVGEVRDEHESYQTAITKLMTKYSKKVTEAQSALSKIPGTLEAQTEAHAQAFTSSMEGFVSQVSDASEAVSKMPAELDIQLQKNRAENIAELKQIQEQYASELAKTSEVIAEAQSEISKIPDALKVQVEATQQRHTAELEQIERSYAQTLTSSMEGLVSQVSDATEVFSKVPSELDVLFQKDRNENIAGLKQIQEQYAADLAKTNEVIAKQLQTISEQIKNDSNQQYYAFLNELGKVMDSQLAQLSDTETRVMKLSQQLELKYDAFLHKIESTNMAHIHEYCQDMNKSINVKLKIILGTITVVAIASIISLFV